MEPGALGAKCWSPRYSLRRGYDRGVRAQTVKALANECGFELAGIARALPLDDDFARYQSWMNQDYAGKMGYLTDHRAELRNDPRKLLPQARSIICVGKLYNQPLAEPQPGDALISRYAITRDYHHVLREQLERLAAKLSATEAHEWKACVDTAPLLDRSYARQAGLGWIGKNTCLINEQQGSWFFLGALLTTLEFEISTPEIDTPPPDRCGTCTRCIDACPTQALVPTANGEFTLDARRCISYLTIELRGPISEALHADMGAHIFGCDICQEVCPWNSRAPFTDDRALAAVLDASPPLEEFETMSRVEFQERYAGTPVTRPRFEGFERNVNVARKNAGAKPGTKQGTKQ